MSVMMPARIWTLYHLLTQTWRAAPAQLRHVLVAIINKKIGNEEHTWS